MPTTAVVTASSSSSTEVDLEFGSRVVRTTGSTRDLTRQQTNDPNAWNIDGTNGHYHHKPSLYLVMWAQIIYIVSTVIIIPTGQEYTQSLGADNAVYFGLVVGISSIVDPLVSRLWSYVLKGTSLKAVLSINALINLVSCVAYAMAKWVGTDISGGAGFAVLLASRVVLGLGSVQTANYQYLGCAVSSKKTAFAHFLTTATISYGFAFGIFLAFVLSAVGHAHQATFDQSTLPGWFTALLWLAYLPLHWCVFREPDRNAGIIDPDSQIRLSKQMKPSIRLEPFGGLGPCVLAILAVAVVSGAFEVMTISITQSLWSWGVMRSATYLGGVMLVVALTTLLAYPVTRKLGEGATLSAAVVAATLLLPFFYIPTSTRFHDRMGTSAGMGVYLGVSILALSLLNIARTIAFTLLTELPSPMWRDYFLSTGSQIFTMGRGVGPVLAGALASRNAVTITVMVALSAAAALAVCAAQYFRKFWHEVHETGPARAEELERHELPSWLQKSSTWSRGLSGEDFGSSGGGIFQNGGLGSSSRAVIRVAVGTAEHSSPEGVRVEDDRTWNENPIYGSPAAAKGFRP
jgi:MFS family permease